MKPCVVVTFYLFTEVPQTIEMKPALLACMHESDIKGTIILATEGINGTLAGIPEAIQSFLVTLRGYPGLADLTVQTSFHDVNPFKKAKVKWRKEIVTLGADNIHPLESTGVHLAPAQWDALLAEDNVVVIDTRNDYEVALGTFKGSVNPTTENFRDFPTYVSETLSAHKDKKIAMFCTGGVRCEKSTAYLKQLGFENVYQLKGGILNYMANTPTETSRWEGSCFVFDDRVALNHDLSPLEPGSIDVEWKNNHKKAKRLA